MRFEDAPVVTEAREIGRRFLHVEAAGDDLRLEARGQRDDPFERADGLENFRQPQLDAADETERDGRIREPEGNAVQTQLPSELMTVRCCARAMPETYPQAAAKA